MSEFIRDMPFGATLAGGEQVVFCLWAPAQQTVAVEIDGAAAVPMQRTDCGNFTARTPGKAGTRYRFRLGSGEAVPDPASRAQAGDIHDWSVVVDPRAFRWKQAAWKGRPWHESVLYELHVGACGGFRGVMARIPDLAALGITAIELMPVNDFPGKRNWGYDGALPFAPDSAYGTPDELKALIDEAHACGLMIFLDVVYNHFGPDGNYLPIYAPAFFREDIKTPWGPAIDFRQSQVRRFFAENALYWLMEYRFDGLRFDAVHAITDQTWLDELATEIRQTVEPDRAVHLVLEHEDNIASHLRNGFDAQWNDDAHHVLHVLLTSEADHYYADYAGQAAQLLARCLSEGFAYQGQPSKVRKGEPRGTPSADLPPTSFVLFLQNHDQIGNRPFGERLTTLADPHALRAAVALQLLCPHIPLIFMGEEEGSAAPFLYFTDHHGDLAEAVREGRRREFAGFAAFADEAKRASIPDPNDPATFDRSLPEVSDARSETRGFYASLLALRASLIVPRLIGSRSQDAKVIGPSAVIATWRMGDGAFLSLASNFAADPVTLSRPDGKIVFGSMPDNVLEPRTTVAFLAIP